MPSEDTWMGSLAAQDQYRPMGNDPWTNQMRGSTPDIVPPEPPSPVIFQSSSNPMVRFTEKDIDNAMGAAMATSGGGLATKGIRAYHSSPHDFDRFDLSKIGSGEGAQAYGHGLYFAENPTVSGQGGQYWNQFLRTKEFPDAERVGVDYLKMQKFDREKAAEMLRTELAGEAGKGYPDFVSRQAALKLLESGKPVGPRTYEVNINADPAHFLDWDKPLAGSSRRVFGDRLGMDLADHKTAGDAVRYANKEVGDPSEISRVLGEAGIPGIKYLDQGSRGAGQGSSNFVVFDPKIIDIMKKYGIAGAAPVGMGALAATNAYQPDQGM